MAGSTFVLSALIDLSSDVGSLSGTFGDTVAITGFELVRVYSPFDVGSLSGTFEHTVTGLGCRTALTSEELVQPASYEIRHNLLTKGPAKVCVHIATKSEHNDKELSYVSFWGKAELKCSGVAKAGT